MSCRAPFQPDDQYEQLRRPNAGGAGGVALAGKWSAFRSELPAPNSQLRAPSSSSSCVIRFWGRSPSCVYENCCFTSAAIHTSQIGAAWPALLTVCPLVRPKLRSKSSQDLSLSARPPVRRSTVRLRAPVRVRGLGLPCRRAV